METITPTTLSHLDPTFYEIFCYLNGDRPDYEMHDIFVILTTFRKSLSFQWIEQIREDLRSEMLTKVIITILNLTNDKNTTIRLGAYSTIGTLILSVAPYSPSLFIASFAAAIPEMEVSSKISIAIINSFISLMRFISPVRINDYIERMPILHHFTADVSDFIQYLPITIPQMKKLPNEFLTNILNSLVSKCGNTPNGYFANAISLLVNLKPELLLPELSKKLINKNYDISAVWIGRNLFSDRKCYDLMDKEMKNFILTNAFDQLNRQPLDLSRFDYSCRIIGTALRYELDRLILSKMNPNSGINESEVTTFYEELKEKLKNSLLEKYSSPFRNSLLSLPCENLDDLVDVKSESDSYRASKISAITNFFFDYIQMQRLEQVKQKSGNEDDENRIGLSENKPKIRKCMSTRIGEIRSSNSSVQIPSLFNSNSHFSLNSGDLCKGVADRVAEMLILFVDCKNDLFTNLLDNLSLCINELLIRCKKRVHITMLKKIFSKHDSMKLNWVQNIKLAKLINNINPDLISRFIPDYKSIVTKILLDLTISPTDKLFVESVDVLCNIASYETLPGILDIVKYSDWYSEKIVYKRFYLLAKLAKLFKSDLFTTFVGIAYECLFFCELKSTYSVIFWFLSKLNIERIPNNVKEFAFTFVEKCYFSYAHQPIYKKSYVTDDFVEYDADIVMNPLIDHKTALSPLWHCYRFLCHISSSMKNNSIQSANTNSTITVPPTSKSVSSLATASESNTSSQFSVKLGSPSAAVLPGRAGSISSENIKINSNEQPIVNSTSHLLPHELKRLYHYSISLVKIFGGFALEMASKLSVRKKKFEQEVFNLSLLTFIETDDDKVAAMCASIFVNTRISREFEKSTKEIRKDVFEMLKEFIRGKFTDNLDLIYLCFSGVNMNDHKLAVDAVPKVIQNQWLSNKTMTLLLFKLIKLLGTDIVMSISDENALAFLPLANYEPSKNVSSTKSQSKPLLHNVSLDSPPRFAFSGENLSPENLNNEQKDIQINIKKVQFGQSDSVIYSNNFYREKVRKYISSHHFSDFPIENPELKMSLLKFLRTDEPKIVLYKPEDLDTEHWKFIFENIDCFDISRVSSFIDRNPSVFAKIELSSYSLFSRTFTLLPYNSLPLFASITPFISLIKHPPYCLSLYRSFFLFSGQRMNLKDDMHKRIFEKMVVSTVKSRHVETIKAMMNYSFKFQYEKTLLEIIKSMNQNFSQIVQTPKKRSTLINISAVTKPENRRVSYNLGNPKKVFSADSDNIYGLDSIFFNDELIELTAKIDPESVLQYLGLSKDDRTIIINTTQITNDDLRANIISNISGKDPKGEFNPDFYLDYFITTQIYKKKQYLILIKLLEKVKFSMEKLSDLVIDIIKNFNNFSDKKKHVFIRFLTQSLYALSKHQSSSDFKRFMNLLTIQFSTFAMGSDSSILLDFSYLFGLLSEYTTDGSFFVEFLNSIIGSANSIPPLYLISTSKLVNKKIIPVSSVDPSIFVSILESELPSFNCCVLRALSSTYITNHISGIQEEESTSSNFYTSSKNEPKIVINTQIQETVGNKLQSFKQSFLLTDFLPDFVNNAPEINERFTEVFLCDKNHPCFYRSLRCKTLNTNTLFNLFKLPFTSSEVISALVKFSYNKAYLNTQIVEYFKKFQDTLVYPLLINVQLSGVSDKIIKTFFSTYPSSFKNFLVLFCFLRRFYLRSKEENKTKIKKLIEEKADMTPQSRFFSLMMLCEDSLMEVYLGFIVAATETNDFSKIAQEYDKIIAAT